MSARIGRKFASATYPTSSRGFGAGLFARNFATGPKLITDVPDGGGVQIEWNSIDVGVDPDENVAITPRSTGSVLITGVITAHNGTVGQVALRVFVQIDDVSLPLPPGDLITIEGDGIVAIPILAETSIPVNTTHNVQILVVADTADAIDLPSDGSSLNVQEVPASTG